MKICLFTLLIVLLSLLSPSQNKTPTYKIDVRFNPDSNYLSGRAEILNPGDSVFFLDKALIIQSIKIGKVKARFRQKPSETNANTVEITVNDIPEKIEIAYSGKIIADDYSKTISSLNQVNGKLIELSNHIDWYPRMKGWRAFTYTMRIDVPENFNTVTNGKLVNNEKSIRKRHISVWESDKLCYGITMISAPGINKSVINDQGDSIEIFSTKMPASYIDSMKSCLVQSVQLLDTLFGPTEESHLIRLVYSPRSAGGYARRPLIVVSEKYAMEQRSHPMGFARDFRLNCHEIAHYWSKASTDTPDDWINEGLAEYAALWVSEKVIGKEFADMLVKEYDGIIKGTPTYTPIVETAEGSMEREINRYYKPVVLFNTLREKYGEETLRKFFRDLYLRFNETKSATTSIFLNTLKESAGAEAEEFFREALNRKGWKYETDAMEAPTAEKNRVFIGKWTGMLTQFGTSTRFILNLNVQDGKIIPTLDSPDQNVTGIPVSELVLNGDSISFKVGIASASYQGHLNLQKMLIEGKWNQRNIDYPLNVIKDE